MTSTLPPGVSTDAVAALLRNRLSLAAPAPDADLFAAGLLDSLGLIDLFVALEETWGFAIVVDEVDFEDFRSVEAIARYVTRRLA